MIGLAYRGGGSLMPETKGNGTPLEVGSETQGLCGSKDLAEEQC